MKFNVYKYEEVTSSVKQSITIQLETEEIDLIKRYATEENRSVSSWIRLQILRELNKNKHDLTDYNRD